MADDLFVKSAKQLCASCIKAEVDPVSRRLDELEQHMDRLHQDASDEKAARRQLEERIGQLTQEAADSRANQQQQLQNWSRKLAQDVDAQEEILQGLQKHTEQRDKDVVELQQRIQELDKEAADVDKRWQELHDIVDKLQDETEIAKVSRQEGLDYVDQLSQEFEQLQGQLNEWKKCRERPNRSSRLASPVPHGASDGVGWTAPASPPQPQQEFPPIADEVCERPARGNRTAQTSEACDGPPSEHWASKRRRCGAEFPAGGDRATMEHKDAPPAHAGPTRHAAAAPREHAGRPAAAGRTHRKWSDRTAAFGG
mmetsp:Transcript_120322/g.340931  ORF Transcript_120322/g.340931 Transcript_120322/m.340931 type:complete len:312 (-) Transcript_120322:42-977(-)